MKRKSTLTLLLGLTVLTLAFGNQRLSEQHAARAYSGKRAQRADRSLTTSAETWWRPAFLSNTDNEVEERTTFGGQSIDISLLGVADKFWRLAQADTSRGSGALASRNLTHTSGENLALIKKEISPLAELAAFSIRVLLRSKSDKKSILRLNREIKAEAFGQYYGGRISYQPRSPAALRQFINEGYASLASPDLVKVRLKATGMEIVPPRGPLVWPLKQNVDVPIIFTNELDTLIKVSLQSPGARQWEHVEMPPHETRGYFVGCVSQAAGKHSQQILLSTETGNARISFPVEVRRTSPLNMMILDENGERTAARVYLTGADGVAHAPANTFLRVVSEDYEQPFSGDAYFYAEGLIGLDLVEGSAVVEIVKGFEYEPLRRELTVGETSETYSLQLKRLVNMSEKGWYSGETHIHANVINNEIIEPEDVWLQVRGEDLNVANLLVSNTVEGTVHDRRFFEGHPHRLSRNNTILYWNQEMRNLGLYGHMAFLNLKSLVEPFYTGFAQTEWSEDYPPNYSQAVKAKAQGAVVTQVHPSATSGEYPVDLALGAMDALDVMSQVDEQAVAKTWYRLLNCGIRCAISAGTDSFLNVIYNLIPGANRLYVHSGTDLTYEKWIRGYKQGRSFATNGPLLFLTVNGKEPGEEIRSPGQPTSLWVEAQAISHLPMDNLEIIVNGEVAASASTTHRNTLKFSGKLPLVKSSWIAARVNGPGHRLIPNDRLLFAHTNPVYCYVADQRIISKSDAEFFVEWIDNLIANVEQKGTFRDAGHRKEVIELFRKGQAVYRRIAAQAH